MAEPSPIKKKTHETNREMLSEKVSSDDAYEAWIPADLPYMPKYSQMLSGFHCVVYNRMLMTNKIFSIVMMYERINLQVV